MERHIKLDETLTLYWLDDKPLIKCQWGMSNRQIIEAVGKWLDENRDQPCYYTVDGWLKDFEVRIPTPLSMLEEMKKQGSVSTTNESDVLLLLQGRNAWNSARLEQRTRIPDLSGLRLSNFDFRYYDFSGMLLREVNLSGSNLDHADFGVVNGSWAARTQDQPLKGADFTGAILTDCDFRCAKCEYAIFRHAALAGADFLGACSEKQTLQTVTYEGPILNTPA